MSIFRIAVNALGHADPDWLQPVTDQAALLAHVSNVYYTIPQTELSKRLVASSFAERVFSCNSGTEANEAAIKFSRKFQRFTHPEDKEVATSFIAFTNSFHGVTFLEYGNSQAATDLIRSGKIADVFVEPIQEEGGVSDNMSRTILDLFFWFCYFSMFSVVWVEVVTYGLWAFEAFGVTPDIMTVAKSLAGGLPIGVMLVTEKVAETIKYGDHGSIFAGNPLVCSAAIAVFDKVSKPSFLASVSSKGLYFKDLLVKKLGGNLHVKKVRGEGLIIGVELDVSASPLVDACCGSRLLILILTAGKGNVVPPLIIEEEEIGRAVEIMFHIHDDYPWIIPFWVEITGIPLHLWTVKNLRNIGSKLGHINTMELSAGRLLIDVDTRKPLVFTRKVKSPEGEEVTIKINYELLFKHCSFGGMLTHKESYCPKKMEFTSVQSSEARVFARVQLPADNLTQLSLQSVPRERDSHITCKDYTSRRNYHDDVVSRPYKPENHSSHRSERELRYKNSAHHEVSNRDSQDRYGRWSGDSCIIGKSYDARYGRRYAPYEQRTPYHSKEKYKKGGESGFYKAVNPFAITEGASKALSLQHVQDDHVVAMASKTENLSHNSGKKLASTIVTPSSSALRSDANVILPQQCLKPKSEEIRELVVSVRDESSRFASEMRELEPKMRELVVCVREERAQAGEGEGEGEERARAGEARARAGEARARAEVCVRERERESTGFASEIERERELGDVRDQERERELGDVGARRCVMEFMLLRRAQPRVLHLHREIKARFHSSFSNHCASVEPQILHCRAPSSPESSLTIGIEVE
ncbi:hypothetical protein HID58_006192 [Brassica napus]|uniref:Zinc knuckle CX2CX4HX4C domain-containing protein n=1 Tax=Brassica napus TaxID=3708 RepID=A0ABQ8EAP3_BRANA|nr:hypothetical protein HID58_006192 [Brassica napus]